MRQTDLKELPQKYQDLLLILRPGADKALSSTEIRQLIGLEKRDIGAITAELVTKHGYLIGASRKYPFGYYIIDSEDDLKQTLRSLNNELQGILERHKALYTNYYNESKER